MDMVWTWSTDILKQNPWVGNTHFLHGFGLRTHQILFIYEWGTQNILTRSISYDILGILIMDMVY